MVNKDNHSSMEYMQNHNSILFIVIIGFAIMLKMSLLQLNMTTNLHLQSSGKYSGVQFHPEKSHEQGRCY